jgi:uncharacterized membrane protein
MEGTPVLFEARSAPLHALGGFGLRLVIAVLAAGFLLTGVLFALLGAWPVLVFAGAEGLGVILLLLLYRRHARRSVEVVTLTDRALTVRRREGSRVTEARFEPGWARLERREAPDGTARLFLAQRAAEVEVGKFLAAEERDEMEAALRDALRRLRNPVFDNPQLR